MNSTVKALKTASPDDNAAGFLVGSLNPLRYDSHAYDPDEVSGIVAGMIPERARVLDVGCGTGILAQILTECRQADVVGIEPDPSRAKLAISRGLTVHAGYLTPETVESLGKFDVVLFADVIEHLPSPQAILTTARGALAEGGAVVLSVPNVAHWSVRVDLIRGRFQYRDCGIMDATHLRWFTANSIKLLLESVGLRPVEYRATAGLALSDNFLRRPWRWLRQRPRERLLRAASKHWPTLFGCQHVLKATL